MTTNRERIETALNRGQVVAVTILVRTQGVELPDYLSGLLVTTLNLSLGYRDIQIITGASGLRATLFFNGAPYRVQVPWDAVIGIVEGGIPSAPPTRVPLRLIRGGVV